MADIKKARIFLRRGTDTSRLGTELCEGELGYSTDGTRIYIGDGSTLGGNSVGSTVFILPAASGSNPDLAVTTLTAASADGRAEVGDFAFIPASSYYLSSFNSGIESGDSENINYSPAETFGTLYLLSARDGGTGELTWVVANSGIPFSHLDLPDNSIAGDKIHGGNISGNITFTGPVSATTITATSARFTELSGTGYRPVVASADGDIVIGSGGVPVAMAGFTQDGTLNYDYGITSVSLIALSTLSSEAVSGDTGIGSDTGDGNNDFYTVWSNANQYSSSGNSGIYKITLDNPVLSVDTAVEVQALNWRAPYNGQAKTNQSITPIVDYYWKSTKDVLYVVFSVAITEDSDKQARGGTGILYPSSGIQDPRTRFVVKIY